MGDGIDIIKGTGPGTSMGVLSRDQQLKLVNKNKTNLEYQIEGGSKGSLRTHIEI